MYSASATFRGFAWGFFAISIWVAWMLATRWGVKSTLDFLGPHGLALRHGKPDSAARCLAQRP
jgi:hypothetical protein